MNTETFEMYRRPDPMVLPELESLGRFSTAEYRLGGMRVDGSAGLEVGFLEQGSVEWWDGRQLDEAGPNSVLFDPPGDWQGGVNALVHPCTRYWLRFRFPASGGLPGLPPSTTAAMAEAFAAIDAHHFAGSPALRDLFVGLLDQQRRPGAFAEDYCRSLFHQILISVLRDYARDRQRTVSGAIRQAVAHLAGNTRSDVRIEDVARLVRLSPGYLNELFQRETGSTPARFHLRCRVNAAKKLLIETGWPVTAIAMELGFSSSQYFATTFKRVVGLTPLAYRHLRTADQPRAG